MKRNSTLFLTQAAIIAAIYTTLVVIFAPMSFGPIQMRVAEALTILPFFTPAAIPGVTIGCFLGGLFTGADVLDLIFGSMATLIGAFLSYGLRKNKFLVPIPPILCNAIIIPWVLRYAYDIPDAIPFMMATVAIGQIGSVGILGLLLLFSLNRVKHIIFKNEI